MNKVDKDIAPFPHCDQNVLHAPNECEFCDMYPEAQDKRIVDGVNFTGQSDPNKTQCPAEARRKVEIIHGWYGNTPKNPWKPKKKVIL